MTIESAKKDYPNFFEKVTEDICTDRELVVADHNCGDIASEEYCDFDLNMYNHFACIAEIPRMSLSEDSMMKLQEKLRSDKNFDTFFASEDDFCGIQTNLNDKEISKVVFAYNGDLKKNNISRVV